MPVYTYRCPKCNTTRDVYYRAAPDTEYFVICEEKGCPWSYMERVVVVPFTFEMK